VVSSQADESDVAVYGLDVAVHDAKMARVWVNPRTFSSRDAGYAEEQFVDNDICIYSL